MLTRMIPSVTTPCNVLVLRTIEQDDQPRPTTQQGNATRFERYLYQVHSNTSAHLQVQVLVH